MFKFRVALLIILASPIGAVLELLQPKNKGILKNLFEPLALSLRLTKVRKPLKYSSIVGVLLPLI